MNSGGKDDLLLMTAGAQALRVPEEEFRAMGRGARGVRDHAAVARFRGHAELERALHAVRERAFERSAHGVEPSRRRKIDHGLPLFRFAADADVEVFRVLTYDESVQGRPLLRLDGQGHAGVALRRAEVHVLVEVEAKVQ